MSYKYTEGMMVKIVGTKHHDVDGGVAAGAPDTLGKIGTIKSLFSDDPFKYRSGDPVYQVNLDRSSSRYYCELDLQPIDLAESKSSKPTPITYKTVTTITSSDGHTFTETEIDGKSVEELKQYRSLLSRHARLFKKASAK